MMHRGQPEAGQTPQVGGDVVANPGRESHDGEAERDRGAAHVRNPDPLSREVQPEHERADQQRQEKDAVVPDAHAGGETEEGPVVPAAMGRPGDPNREQEAEGDEEEHQRVDPRPHAIADGVQRKHRGDARRQQGAPTLPSPASWGGISDVGEEPAGQRVHCEDVNDANHAQRETDRELGRAEDRDKGRQHVRLDRPQVMAPTFDDRQVAAQDVDGGDAPGRLISIEWLQQADEEAHAKSKGEDQRQYRPPHAYRALCVGGNSGNRGAAASAVSRCSWYASSAPKSRRRELRRTASKAKTARTPSRQVSFFPSSRPRA